MIFDVEVRGKRHHVEVVRTAEGDHVSIDGRMFSSQIVAAMPFWSLLVKHGERAVRSSRSYEVGFNLDQAAQTLDVSVDGTMVPVRLVDRRRSRARGGVVSDSNGAHQLFAPMPGRIIRVLVAAGDRVKSRQPIVVIEAMKMENELQAALAGTVTDVRVVSGDTVEAGALLVVVTA